MRYFILLILSLLACLTSCSNLKSATGPRLVAAYSFSESSGATTADDSGNNNIGTLVGGATRITTGKYGNAIAFDGGSGVVRIPDSRRWKVNGLTGYTVSLWVKVKDVTGDYKFAIGTGSWPANDLYIFKEGGAWKYGLYTAGGANNWGCGGETSALGYLSTVDNTYHHIALVMNAASSRCDFYSDGQVVGTDTYVDGATSFRTGAGFSDLFIGGLNGTHYFSADIDEVHLYTWALTQAEIQSDMKAPIVSALLGDTKPQSFLPSAVAPLPGLQM
jgi:Concanavalin A-like lectin/glucanases superfamily